MAPQVSLEQMQLLLREVMHRCANDLQLVTSLLRLQGRNAASDEVRAALDEAADRVSVLAQARKLTRAGEVTLEAALQHVCAALNSQAEPRSVIVALQLATEVEGLSEVQVTRLAMCVNELATNALKHAFEGRACGGRITIAVRRDDDRNLAITVDDDGLPMPRDREGGEGSMGLDLVRGLALSVGGELHEPGEGSKRFELRVPIHHDSEVSHA